MARKIRQFQFVNFPVNRFSKVENLYAKKSSTLFLSMTPLDENMYIEPGDGFELNKHCVLYEVTCTGKLRVGTLIVSTERYTKVRPTCLTIQIPLKPESSDKRHYTLVKNSNTKLLLFQNGNSVVGIPTEVDLPLVIRGK
jgi:hypothetical protein